MEKLQDTKVVKTELKQISIEQVKDTPFTCVKRENLWYITCGNNLCSTKKFKTLKSAKDYIYSKPYELIGSLIIILTNKEFLKQNNHETKH